MFGKRRRNHSATIGTRSTTTSNHNSNQHRHENDEPLDVVLGQHLSDTLFITGAFCVAWAWDLVYYGASHAVANINPLQEQLGFGTSTQLLMNHTVSHDWIMLQLLLEYLIVCAMAAVMSYYCYYQHPFDNTQDNINPTVLPEVSDGTVRPSVGVVVWGKAASMAIEFFPSPVFAGKLMLYLNNLHILDPMECALVNLMATAVAASLVHWFIPWLENIDTHHDYHCMERFHLQRFGVIVQNTLGFGLGIAWNTFFGNLLGPSQKNDDNDSNDYDLDLFRIVALGGYLAVVTLIAFRLAAQQPIKPIDENAVPTFFDRQLSLLTFSMYVVNAFTLVAFLRALLHSGWIGAIESLCLLLCLSAAMTYLVSRTNLEEADAETVNVEESITDLESMHSCQRFQEGPFGFCSCFVLLFPCVWCCCPWIPMVWLLAGTENSLHVKEHWYKLIAMVSGLAASIVASSILTDTTNALATPFCTAKTCHHPWLFVVLQIVLAFAVTLIIIPIISNLPSSSKREISDSTNAGTTAVGNTSLITDQVDEKQPLLKRFRDKFTKSKNVATTEINV